MANHKQAKKRILINAKKRRRNMAIHSALKTYMKKAKMAIEAQEDQEETKQKIQAAISEIDKAATKGIIHKNNAARKKSRLLKHFHKAYANAS